MKNVCSRTVKRYVSRHCYCGISSTPKRGAASWTSRTGAALTARWPCRPARPSASNWSSQIKDPVAYTFNFIEPELTVRQASEASLRTVVGRHNIDEALTSGKFMIQEEAKELIQNILDKYNTGILVVAVQLQDVSPPEQVISAFKDVASAKEDKNRMVNQAEGYRNDVIPKARGEAQAQIREAEGYKEARIARAEGDVSKFNAVLKEYRKSKEVTETRLFLETAEEILSNREKIIVPDGKEGSNLINLLNLKAKEGK